MEQETNNLINCLHDLGYPVNFIEDISAQLNKLFKDIDFDSIKQRASQAARSRIRMDSSNPLRTSCSFLKEKAFTVPMRPYT